MGVPAGADDTAIRAALIRLKAPGAGLTAVRARLGLADGAPESEVLNCLDGLLDSRRRDEAQELDSHIGTVVRIRPDGSVPEDNPFVGREGALPEIYSYGHRNQQGAALHPVTGQLWTHEHGPRGGDEVNVIRAGANYGWPVITYGREYHGPSIGEGTAKEGMEQPLHYWVPSIAPSGMAFYESGLIEGWRGDLLVGALASMQLVRLEFDDANAVTNEERIDIGERVRDVRVWSDGAVYLLTDTGSKSRLLRIRPALR